MKPKLTYELIGQMAALKADGLSNKDICRAVGINEATLYRWLKEPRGRLHRALSDELKKAEAAYKQELLSTIREAAREKAGHWTAAAWLLERKYPEEYGKAERKLDDGKAEAAPQIVLGVTVARAAGDACLPGDGEAAGLPGDRGADA